MVEQLQQLVPPPCAIVRYADLRCPGVGFWEAPSESRATRTELPVQRSFVRVADHTDEGPRERFPEARSERQRPLSFTI